MLFIFISIITLPINYSLASVGYQIYAFEKTYTRRRKITVAYKFGRQSSGMGIRKFGTSLQDQAEEGYNLYGYEIWNFDREIFKLKSIVGAKTSIARVQLTL